MALLAVGGLVSGCGESAKAHSLRASGPVTKAEASIYAHEVTLGTADVSGMVSVGLEEEEKVKRPEVELAQCAGGVDPNRRIVAINSPHFRSGSGLQTIEVTSHVEVMPSAQLAARDLVAVRSARGRACFARSGQRRLTKAFSSATVGRIAVLAMPDPLPSQASSFGFRAIMPLTLRRAGLLVHTRMYADDLGFTTGPAEVSLTAFGFSNPVPTATEQRLLSLLHSRA